eukprot:TRINITY_DN3831_c0_g1_i1.p1 TRINITY_DN3831_c0_g1~~TRINITY_DN3831_c0_g1_i1.p1  ORF type:complete len:296 (-),score=44.10 TRINITY_DN3831_c0_g1_i1:94-981(-)
MEALVAELTSMREWNSTQWDSFIERHYQDFPDADRSIVPRDSIESIWLYFTKTYGDYYVLLNFYIFLNVCYAGSAFVFWVIDYFHLFASYKIQEKYPTQTDYIKCALNLFQNYVVLILPGIIFGYPFFRLMGFNSNLPIPWLEVVRDVVLFALVEDVTHYFLHRILHTPWLYKNIHKVHHHYASPFGLAAAYAHPLEVIILGFATFLGPLLFRGHFFSFLMWILYRQLDAVITHCGYHIPNPLHYIPFYGGTDPHDYHHKTFIYNYSSRFTFMDILLGTGKYPKEVKKKVIKKAL